MEGHDILAALAGMFAEPGGAPGSPSLADDAAAACEVPGHEPAHASVACMLALFPGLAPAPAPAP